MRRASLLCLLAALAACNESGLNEPGGTTGGWLGPQRIGSPAWAGEMKLALDEQGAGVAVWMQSRAPTGTWAAGLSPAGAWSSPERLDGDVATHAVGAAGTGHFFTAWRGSAGPSALAVFARGFVPGQGWSEAVRLSESGQTDTIVDSASQPDLAVAPDGSAVAAWRQIVGGEHRIWAARHAPTRGWDPADLLAVASGNASAVRVAMDAAGNATCAWLAFDARVTAVRAARLAASGGWGAPEELDAREGPGSLAHPPATAMGSAGEAFVVVPSAALRAPRGELWAYRARTGAGWEAPVQIAQVAAEDVGDSFFPAVAADSSGNAAVAWLQSGRTGPIDAWVNRYGAGVGWAAARRLETREANAYTPAVAVGGGGQAWALWLQAETTGGAVELNRVWSSRFASGAWSTPETISTAERAQPPDVDANAAGTALAAWAQGDFQSEAAWANRFVMPSR